MVINLFLDENTAQIAQYYGDLSDVVNKILHHGALGEIPIMDLPTVPSSPTKQYKVNVTDEDYIKLCELYGTKSSRISLRRIVYWFFETEKYIELEWTSDAVLRKKDDVAILELLTDIECKLYKLYKLTGNIRTKTIKNEMDSLRSEVWNA